MADKQKAPGSPKAFLPTGNPQSTRSYYGIKGE